MKRRLSERISACKPWSWGITLGAAALLRARVTQSGDWHPPAKFGFAKMQRTPTWHLLCHGDMAASPTPGSRTASL